MSLYCKLFKYRFKVNKINFLKYIIGYNILYIDLNYIKAILE